MIEYFKEKPYWIAILVALIILTVWVFYKAFSAGKKRRNANNDLIKKLKKENELINEFAILTETLIKSSDAARLFQGVSLNLQKRVAAKEDIMGEFNSLSDEQKNVYAFYCVCDDGAENLSEFFKSYSRPITDIALSAAEKMLSADAFEIFAYEYRVFDPDNEECSYIPSEITALDEKFNAAVSAQAMLEAGGKYITENFEKFI